MAKKATYFAHSSGPNANLRVGKTFSDELYVHGSWNNVEIHGGNVVIGEDIATSRSELGLSLSEPLPAFACRRGDLLVLLGTDAASVQLEFDRSS